MMPIHNIYAAFFLVIQYISSWPFSAGNLEADQSSLILKLAFILKHYFLPSCRADGDQCSFSSGVSDQLHKLWSRRDSHHDFLD